ncbi:hypothetical protein [Agathobacter sp.]
MDLQKEHELHRLLGALFLPELDVSEKSNMLEQEFDIQMEGNRKELLEAMCNLGQGIKEQGVAQGVVQGIEQGRKKEVFDSVRDGDYGIVRGAEKLNLSVAEFERQMDEAGYQIPETV